MNGLRGQKNSPSEQFEGGTAVHAAFQELYIGWVPESAGGSFCTLQRWMSPCTNARRLRRAVSATFRPSLPCCSAKVVIRSSRTSFNCARVTQVIEIGEQIALVSFHPSRGGHVREPAEEALQVTR